jgi:two-component system, NtrC family, sensor kinase
LNMAEAELKRVVHIARQTLGFYRETNKAEELRLTEIFDQVADVFEPNIRRKNIELHRDYRSAGEVLAFPGEMRQLFTNLISNAIEADATRIRVRASSYREWSHPFRWGTRLTFSDNGKGIPSKAMQNIFEPFFTTKGEKGTGLGLWVTRGIVHKYEGKLDVHSRISGPRKGTSFSIFFPAACELVKNAPGRLQTNKEVPRAA